MNPFNTIPAVILGLSALAAPITCADTAAAPVPGSAQAQQPTTVGAAIAALPLLGEQQPNTAARYYIYLCSASWCGPCNKEMPRTVELYNDMKRAGNVELLLIDCDQTEEDARKFMDTYGVTFPAIMSSNASGLPGFSAPRSVPRIIIVDSEGKVIKSGHASLLRDWWQQHISGHDAQG